MTHELFGEERVCHVKVALLWSEIESSSACMSMICDDDSVDSVDSGTLRDDT